MMRVVQPELLDSLPPDHPQAVHSRRDLVRVNRWMRNPMYLAAAIQQALPHQPLTVLTDLGAGDGTFLVGVARQLRLSNRTTQPPAAPVIATLLDLHCNVSAATLEALAALGWHGTPVVADVFDWPQPSGPREVVIANLFLHHFDDPRLGSLLRLISQRAELFIAIEPRRAPFPLLGSRLLGWLGCNAVTRHDAVVSVRAGFAGRELSARWPQPSNWRLTERRAGAFSHLFIAQRTTEP